MTSSDQIEGFGQGARASLRAARCRASLVLLATAAISSAALAESPDLYLVAGRDWRVVLPVSVLAARGETPVPLLLPEEGKERWFEHFIERYRPAHPAVIVSKSPQGEEEIGLPWPDDFAFPAVEGEQALPFRLFAPTETLLLLLADHVFPAAEEDVPGPPLWLVDSSDYRSGLLAAVAAGAERGLLLPIGEGGTTPERALRFAESRRSPIRWGQAASTRAGDGAPARAALMAAAEERGLAVEVVDGVRALTLRAATAFAEGDRDGLPPHLVITNPDDTEGWFSPPHLSLLAPLFAIARKAPLALSAGLPEDLERDLSAFRAAHGDVSHISLIGDYLALRMREMLDPDQVHAGVEEPRTFKIPALAGIENLEPAEYAVGRLAAEDVHDLSLQVGRILSPRRALGSAERPALMLANADEIFVMAELVSSATVKEMENVGWEVAAHYGDDIDRELIFREMPGKEVVIWTGHPRDLTVDYDIGVVDQILDATLVFLQGCYTLDRNDPYILIQQGAAGVIGTYMAVYSASGSAFAKTVLDAMLYYGADQGEAMVHARNYLLAYVAMKRQRGHSDWRKTWRAALSFDLWGDPTARTMPPRTEPSTPPVRLVREDDVLRFDVPEERFTGLSAGRYTVETPAGGQLGSIYTRTPGGEPERRMQPFYFGWIELPEHESEPELMSEVPEEEWVSLWAPGRRRLYLMVHNKAEQSVGREGMSFRIVREQVPLASDDEPGGQDDP